MKNNNINQVHEPREFIVEYTPHKKQKEFHDSLSKSRWVFGGNRTGKTMCGAIEAVRKAMVSATEGWVVSVSLQVQRDVAQRKILQFLPECEIHAVVMKSGSKATTGSRLRGVIDFIQLCNGSKIGFKSCDQGREKFQGTGLDWIWFDEEPPEDIYEECLLRTLDKGGIVWGTMTPLKGKTWLHDRIYLNQDVHKIIQMSWDDNTYLNESEKNKMERNLSADVLESRKFGRFQEGGGVVFSELSDVNVINPIKLDDERYVTIMGIDPGYTAPTGAVWVKTDGEVYFVVGDYSESEKTVEEHALNLKSKFALFGTPSEVFIDSAATQKSLASGDTTVALQFNRHGINVNTHVKKCVGEGVHHIKSLLRNVQGERRLFIFRTCQTLLREMRGYYWGEGEAPVKKDDHCLDALRYVLMSHAKALRKNPRASPIAEKKQELLKRRTTYES